MSYYIDCPECQVRLSDADQATLEQQFVTHAAGHKWSAARATAYFPLNCHQIPVPV